MKIEEILDAWDIDAKIDRTELGEVAAEIQSKLHTKYLRLYTEEKMLMASLQHKMKRLRLAKHQFYTEGPSKESKDNGWTLPPRGMILKTDVPMYLEADEQMSDLQLRIEASEIKISALESIMRAINGRSYIIRDMIDWARWTGGA